MGLRALVVGLLLILLVPARSFAVTVDDVVALSAAGVAEDIIVAVIDADRTVFTLAPDEIVRLKRSGVADAVIVKMVGSAREYTPPRREPLPGVVVIGADSAPPAKPRTVVMPVFVPFAVPLFPVVPVPPAVAVPVGPSIEGRPGFGRFINDGWVDGIGFGRFMNNGWIDLKQPVAAPPASNR